LGATLETNEILLENGAARRPAELPEGVRVVDPVLIEDGCTLERCTVGPNVTLEAGSTVRDATVAHTIAGNGCTIEQSELVHSMLGDRVTVRGFRGTATLGSDASVQGES
jgi:glucose-1-phosphate thymidylyltransferase